MQLGQIAKLLDIHQSNVTRQLERLQSKLREQVVAILSTRHGLSLAAIEECLNDVVENPQTMAILEFIKGTPRQAPEPQAPPPATSIEGGGPTRHPPSSELGSVNRKPTGSARCE